MPEWKKNGKLFAIKIHRADLAAIASQAIAANVAIVSQSWNSLKTNLHEKMQEKGVSWLNLCLKTICELSKNKLLIDLNIHM